MLSDLFLSVPGVEGVSSSPGLCCYFTPFITSLTLDFEDGVQRGSDPSLRMFLGWFRCQGWSQAAPEGRERLMLQLPGGWLSAPAELC